ncbi:hypothetical protein PPACK8108_LOCUS7448 [Phakopsora pachyrhizi]|uniref:Uncharacterized protein n=1 Tax=Phakopsora pachyrhizi TaxID=170000 RepID=A0AAV0ASW4_PHAPC|nr:hypothetical protein PPACK8108_LOCUS7448 [Phakopsora pachyrhizi]
MRTGNQSSKPNLQHFRESKGEGAQSDKEPVQSNQFPTQKERDQHLCAKLKRLRELVSSRGETLNRVISDENEIKENLDSLVKSSDEIRQNLDHNKDWIHSTSAELMELRANNHNLNERRKLLWKDDSRPIICQTLSFIHKFLGKKPCLKWGWADMTTHPGGNQC